MICCDYVFLGVNLHVWCIEVNSSVYWETWGKMRETRTREKVGGKKRLQITGVYRPAIWHCCHGNPDLPQSQSPQCKARRDRKVKKQAGTNIPAEGRLREEGGRESHFRGRLSLYGKS